jgi:hypothetical protein
VELCRCRDDDRDLLGSDDRYHLGGRLPTSRPVRRWTDEALETLIAR